MTEVTAPRQPVTGVPRVSSGVSARQQRRGRSALPRSIERLVTTVTCVDEAGVGRRRQNEVYRAGVYGRSPRVPVAARALQARAKQALNARAYAYVAGGAGDEVTQRANRAAFDRRAVIPRVLRDVSTRDTSVELVRPAAARTAAPRSGRGTRARAPGGRPGGGPGRRIHRRPDGVRQPGVGVDGGLRRGDGGRSALVPAVLVDLGRAGREPAGAARGRRLYRCGRHARDHHPRLAPLGRGLRLPAVRARQGDRPVPLRP